MAANTKKNKKEENVGDEFEDTLTASQKVLGAVKGMYPSVITTVILGGLAVLAMWGINNWNPLEGGPVSSSLWESFFAVFGLMYTIIAGLFLVESCRRRNELSSIINSEVNAIGDIHDCLEFFGNNKKNQVLKDNITEGLCNYVDLMDKDWDAMKDPRSQAEMDEDKRKKPKKVDRLKSFPDDKGIRPVIGQVCKLAVKGEREKHALGVICDRVFEITTHRTNRRELARHGLSRGLYLLIPFMSVVIWVATMLLPVGNDWVHGFIVFSTTVALIALFLLLADADHPFSGLFRIRREILNDIRRKLGCRAKREPPKAKIPRWKWPMVVFRKTFSFS